MKFGIWERMPRKARIDAPGALHHIIFRGIERRKIFRDNKDRDNFLDRLGNVLSDSGTPCYAWSLIPNRRMKFTFLPTSRMAPAHPLEWESCGYNEIQNPII